MHAVVTHLGPLDRIPPWSRNCLDESTRAKRTEMTEAITKQMPPTYYLSPSCSIEGEKNK